MASAAGDPSTSVEDLCANMLEDCAKIKALLLKLKESLRETRRQHGFKQQHVDSWPGDKHGQRWHCHFPPRRHSSSFKTPSPWISLLVMRP
jgi:hypothetical protein